MVRSDAELARDLMNGDPFLTCEEVADIFRVVPPTVSRWAASGRIKATKTPGGGGWLFRESEIRKQLQGGGPDGGQAEHA